LTAAGGTDNLIYFTDADQFLKGFVTITAREFINRHIDSNCEILKIRCSKPGKVSQSVPEPATLPGTAGAV
jgi:hypothetical protein